VKARVPDGLVLSPGGEQIVAVDLSYAVNEGRNEVMTDQQTEFSMQLQDELARRGHPPVEWPESKAPGSTGVLFTEVDGVTVTLAPNGLLNVSAVRSYQWPKYPTPVIAAACAGELWKRQKARDDANIERARRWRTGHLAPIVGHDLKCGNELCPCQHESANELRRRERGGFNGSPGVCA